jgi:eukaryotic-like serine/threonine-protein kinase
MANDSNKLQQLVQTLVHNAEDLSYTETMRPGSIEESETSTFVALPLLPLGKQNGVLELEIIGFLGEGGMGQVQLVRQHTLQRDVAMKQIKPSRKTAQHIHSLLEEARRTGLLEHPNIIPIHAVGLDEDGLPAIVMKRVEGISWRTLILDDEHPTWKGYQDKLGRHIEIAMQICNALHFAHTRGIIHRDVKPENIMLGDFGEVYLLDWGLSLKPAEDPVSKSVVGTLAYMAPEMLRGSADITPQTDVYLLGASLHEALTKEPRHQGNSLMEVASSVGMSMPTFYYEDVPLELGAICNNAMHVNPRERYESAVAFREALASFLRHRSALALSDTAGEQLKQIQGLADKSDQKRLYKLFTEARFGFEQSLRLWEDNKVAKQGLIACLRLMFEQELSQQNVTSAEVLLAELPGEHPALSQQLQEVKAKLSAEQREQKRLSEFGHQLDLSVSSRQRLYFALAFAGFLVLLSISFLIMRHQSTAVDSYPMHIVASALGFILSLLLTFIGKKSLLKTDVNRRMIYAFLFGTAAIPVVRLQGMLLKIPLPTLIPLELLLLGTGLGLLGASLQRGLFIPSGILLVGSVLTTALPHLWLEFWMLSYVLFMLSVAYVWKRASV